MFAKKILGASVITAAMLAGPAAWAANEGSAAGDMVATGQSSQDFVTMAAQGNLAEISMGQLAQEKGTTEAVKSFGQRLVNDHTKAEQDLATVAKGMNVTLPAEPTAQQKATHDRLASESGAAFDRTFADDMVQDHEKDITAYQRAAASDKDAAGLYAARTLPTLQEHLNIAQAMRNTNAVTRTSNPAAPVATTTAAPAPAATNNGSRAPMPGANSFTEGEAKHRIEKAGYSDVGNLKKDNQGIWRGMAMKNGMSAPVALDYKGNVVSQ